jgi:protease I
VQVCEQGPNTLVTSRKPGDLKAFDEAFLEAFARQAA